MSGKKGFMLLEVIMSVVLITTGLLIVTLSFSTSKKLVLKSRELFHFSLLLSQKIFEAEQKEETKEAGQTGLFKEEDIAFLNGKSLSWSVDVKPVDETDLEDVKLQVYSESPLENGAAVETYLMKSKE